MAREPGPVASGLQVIHATIENLFPFSKSQISTRRFRVPIGGGLRGKGCDGKDRPCQDVRFAKYFQHTVGRGARYKVYASIHSS